MLVPSVLALPILACGAAAALLGSLDPGAAPARPRGPVALVYVDPAGSDSTGDGTAGNPFRTLQRGHDVVDAGGTILARAGAYPFAVSMTKNVLVARDGAGVVTVGPPDVGSVTVAIAASDVTLRDLTFAGGASVLGVLASADRTAVERCTFSGTALGAVRLLSASSSGHRLVDCTFRDVRAVPAAIAVDARQAAGLRVSGCTFSGCDFGLRLAGCPAAQVTGCRFVDHFQAALVVSASDDVVIERCRVTRCGHFATPLQGAAPGEALASLSLVNGSDRAVVLDTIVEDGGGYTGKNTFRSGAATTFDGLFGMAVLDSVDVQVRGCALHRNRFGGLWVGGTSSGVSLGACNLVANGSDNDPGKDVAIYSDGPAVVAGDCFFGDASGPLFDGEGHGNGVIGATVTTTPIAAAPFDTRAAGVVEGQGVAAADRSVALIAADLTGDGWNEVVTVGDHAGTVEVVVNGATGLTGRQVAMLSGSEPVALASGLFDAGSTLDVVALDALGGRAVFLFGDGSGALPGTRAVAVGPRPVAVAVGTLDAVPGDDAAVACQGDAFGPGRVEVLRNDGGGQFNSTPLPGAVAPCALALLDLDADADLDVVAFDLDPAGPGLRLWHGDGSGGFGAVQAIPVDAHPLASASMVVIDQDGGPLDLALSTFQLLPLPGIARVRLFRGDGAGGFGPPLELRRRAGPLQLRAGRLGANARPTLFAVDRGAHEVLALGPIAADAIASFPYAETFGDTPLALAVAPVTNRREADDVVVSEAARAQLVVQRGRRPARVARYGTGCPGTNGVPRGQWASLPQIGSATFALAFDAARPAAPAVLVLGAVPLDLPLPGGCRLLVDMALTLGSGSDAAGAGAVPLAIPGGRELLGASLYAQWFVIDSGGGLFGALAATDGLRVSIGG